MSGQLSGESLTGDGMHRVLELCLSCKACKTECPTAVDMSRLKSDVLQMRHDRSGTPLAAKLLGNVAISARLASGRLAPLANFVQSLPPVRWALDKIAAIDRRRPLPQYTAQTLETWFRAHHSPAAGRTLLLFCDTFTNYFEPHVGQAAVELLEACGYRVELAAVGCCQRPQISRGLVRQAARSGVGVLNSLDELGDEATPILVLEPSCASALVDDVPDLIDDVDLGARVRGRVQSVDQFLADELDAGRLDVELSSTARYVLIHGHCHQKALFGTDSMKRVFDRIPELNYREVDSGCCGMAGSFGYQHYDLSKTIGEDRLFPAVRERSAETDVVACGISCRHQLRDFLNVQAKHWVEVVRVTEKSPRS